MKVLLGVESQRRNGRYSRYRRKLQEDTDDINNYYVLNF